MSVNATIKKFNFTDINFSFGVNIESSIQLQIKMESKLLVPSNKDDLTVMFEIKTEISEPDSNKIAIVANSKIIFKFNEKPKDFEQASKEICLPIAQKEVLKKIDDIVDLMGYPKFDIEIT